MDPNVTIVLVAAIGIVVALIGIAAPIVSAILTYKQAGRVLEANAVAADKAADAAEKAADKAELAAIKVETVRTDLETRGAAVDQKLEHITTLVNSQLTDAVNRLKSAVETIAEGEERMKIATATIEALRAALIIVAPTDPRVQQLQLEQPTGAKL